MSEASELVHAPTQSGAGAPWQGLGLVLHLLAEQRFAQYQVDVRLKLPEPGRRLEADLKALVRQFMPDAGAAEYLGFMLMVALTQDTIVNRLGPAYNAIVPAANTGRKFTAGRKSGTVGKVRGWVRTYMTKHPDATAADAWAAFGKRPPKGCTVSGADIWTDGAGNTSRAWFGTMVSQERAKR